MATESDFQEVIKNFFFFLTERKAIDDHCLRVNKAPEHGFTVDKCENSKSVSDNVNTFFIIQYFSL